MSVIGDIRQAVVDAIDAAHSETVLNTETVAADAQLPMLTVAVDAGAPLDRSFGGDDPDSVRTLSITIVIVAQGSSGKVAADLLDELQESAETAVYGDAALAALIDDITYAGHESEFAWESGIVTGARTLTLAADYERAE